MRSYQREQIKNIWQNPVNCVRPRVPKEDCLRCSRLDQVWEYFLSAKGAPSDRFSHEIVAYRLECPLPVDYALHPSKSACHCDLRAKLRCSCECIAAETVCRGDPSRLIVE